MKRIWLRRLAWAVGGLVVLLLVFGLVVALSFDALVRRGVQYSLEQRTGAGVGLEAARIGVRDGSLRLESLVLSNPPGFGPGPLLSLPELYLRYDPAAAASNRVRFEEVRLHLSELNVVIDRSGRTNLTSLAGVQEFASGGVQESVSNLWSGMPFDGVGRLTLTLGRIQIVDERDPRKNVLLAMDVTNRTFTNVVSVMQLVPLAIEIAMKGGLQLGLPGLPAGTNRPALR